MSELATTYNILRKGFDRRLFIGGSDARIIMGDDEQPCSAFGGRSGVRRSGQTCRATFSSSSGSQLNT